MKVGVTTCPSKAWFVSSENITTNVCVVTMFANSEAQKLHMKFVFSCPATLGC
jgi:hypothetical protein